MYEVETIQEPRPVLVYSTLSRNKKEIMTAATTLGELWADFDQHGIKYSGMKVVIAETSNTLETANSQLLSTRQTILLLPNNVKSGNDDEGLVDWEDGISWADVDWTVTGSNPENYSFASYKDLAIARAKRASWYLDRVAAFLQEEPVVAVSPQDPETIELQRIADKIQAGMVRHAGVFD